ncbi:MAG: hypothetical protein HQM09_23800 [Candidatus Riflebacteria bacterium]|nr:hypothetical protein [Candidatus Riflebacteria bacterium]
MTFLEACRALHAMFVRALELRPEARGGESVEFADMESALKDLLAFQGVQAVRAEQWREAAKAGKILPKGFEIPAYAGWNEEETRLHGAADCTVAFKSHLCLFLKAASQHRAYVLNDLLPGHGLMVA